MVTLCDYASNSVTNHGKMLFLDLCQGNTMLF